MSDSYVKEQEVRLNDLRKGEIFECDLLNLKSCLVKPKLYRLNNIAFFTRDRILYCFTDNEVLRWYENPVVKRVRITKIEYHSP